MKMPAPTNPREFEERFAANAKVSGHGFQTMTHAPCGFCAAPDWLVYGIMEVEAAMTKGATCKVCGRTMRAIFKRGPGAMSFEMVQTGGDDPPDWLQPKPRRIVNGC